MTTGRIDNSVLHGVETTTEALRTKFEDWKLLGGQSASLKVSNYLKLPVAKTDLRNWIDTFISNHVNSQNLARDTIDAANRLKGHYKDTSTTAEIGRHVIDALIKAARAAAKNLSLIALGIATLAGLWGISKSSNTQA